VVRVTLSFSFIVTVVTIMSCADANAAAPEPAKYKVPRLAESLAIDGNWDKPAWRNVEALEIANWMGEKPPYRPRTLAKALYDDKFIYVIFRVEDRYVRAVAPETQGAVWKDSCVEFFFTPGKDVSAGYFNLEVNCGGTALFHFQKAPKKDAKNIEAADLRQVEIAHSLPKIVEPELARPTTWTLEYRIPLAILVKYCKVDRPRPGAVWRANFYKCGDETSHPHWLTWSVVGNPAPDFHLPRFFGVLEFM